MNEAELLRKVNDNSILKWRLKHDNKGKNLLPFDDGTGKYRVEAKLCIDLNLREANAEVEISHNLPVGYSWGGQEYTEFLQELKEWCEQPEHTLQHSNRKNRVSFSYGLDINARKKELMFEDIDFIIGEHAQKFLEIKGIKNLKEHIKAILKLQKTATPKEARDMNRYIFLAEQKQSHKEAFGGEQYYCYGQEKDKTKRFKTPNAIPTIEKEMTTIKNKHKFIN